MSPRVAAGAREWPIYTADAFAAGLDLYVDDDEQADLDVWAEAGMDLRAEYR